MYSQLNTKKVNYLQIGCDLGDKLRSTRKSTARSNTGKQTRQTNVPRSRSENNEQPWDLNMKHNVKECFSETQSLEVITVIGMLHNNIDFL